jgi:hypothetical protein
MNKLVSAFATAVSLGLYTPDQAEQTEKSLRDMGGLSAGIGSAFVVDLGQRGVARLFKKQNVATLRAYAEYSTWVRAAIDIYRRAIGQAAWQIVPHDPSKPVNEKVKKQIATLLDRPNDAEVPYSTLKEAMIEDYIVLGHGVIEKAIRRDVAPYQLLQMDAANLAFVKGWDGSDLTRPRYAEMDEGRTRVLRWLADPMAMVMVNRPRTYDLLGLSHVEVLDRTVRALLEGDEYLLNTVLNPSPQGAFNLGEGATPMQVLQLHAQIQNTRNQFVVMGGAKGAQWIRFNATEREMKILDTAAWFVRQVAAVFQIPTAMLQLHVEVTRANLDSQLANAQEGLGACLWDVRSTERRSIIQKFGKYAEHNCTIDYPVMNRRDERGQAEISKTQIAEQAYISVNEARRDAGKEELPLDIANEVLIQTPKGPIPLSRLQERWNSETDPDDEKTDPDRGDEQDEEEKRMRPNFDQRRVN